MPPNLGGFFMVRSYYPSECHADYFDFERIEALKPAIEACGISTLSQSPMLGDRKSGSAGMPRPISYAVFCLKKKKPGCQHPRHGEQLRCRTRRQAGLSIGMSGSVLVRCVLLFFLCHRAATTAIYTLSLHDALPICSYYPSECHADYFDFERIEALKPAIEACGISTLSQSPMLGFHKQMDNRIKLLEEILSLRMQGVEFDNGDMYVDGHKAASDVRDEFVSVTEKLMDELAQCYNVLPQLDINNTIDHRPEGDEKWFLENEKTVTQFCRKLAAERPLKDIRDEYNYPKKKGIKDECSRLLEASTMKSRRGFAIQRLMNAMRQAHADGWFIVFDTLTLADDRLEAFYDNPNALRDYFRDIGRMVLAAEGRKANDS